MKWASSVVTSANLGQGVRQAAEQVRRQLGGDLPDLAIIFVTPHFSTAYGELASLVQEHLPSRTLVGCTAGGVIGGGVEVEQGPAVSLTAALLPEVTLAAVHSDTTRMPDPDAPPAVWRNWFGLGADDGCHFVILADPFSTAAETFLGGLDYAYPAGSKIGGLASGGRATGENALFLNGDVFRTGVLVLALRGDIHMDTMVAQGCRPIGEPLLVTKCSQNMLLEVNQQPPLRYLGDMVAGLSDYDRTLMRTSLFLGLQTDALAASSARGEYLIRNLIGVDYTAGVLAVGALLNEGQVVQFHLRDRLTSSEDLAHLMQGYVARTGRRHIGGALLFSCVGRGQHLYGIPNHDSEAFLSRVCRVPIGGFFCNGEIGPVGGATHVHGYTSSFGIFRPRATGGEGGLG